MNNDKQLRKTLDDALVEDLVPDFDPDTGWQEVSRRLKPARRRIALKEYLPYAAAVASVLLFLFQQNKSTSFTLVAVRETTAKLQQAPQPAPRADSLPAPEGGALAARPPRHSVAAPAVPARPTVSFAPQGDTVKVIAVVADPVPLKESLPVKHYADIAPVVPAAEEYAVENGQKKGFWRSRIARRRIAPQTGTKEETPIRGLMYAFSNKE